MKNTYHTDSGMLCIWNYENFKHVYDYDSWDKELCEDSDILRNIKNNSFVPLNLGDGAFEVDVRINEAALSEREKEYLLVPSHPYLLKSNGKICISGLEHVSAEPGDNIAAIDLESGEYIVQVNLIDWNQEPGAVDENGNPTDKALPDMIVIITKHANEEIVFRTEIETFRKEDALR